MSPLRVTDSTRAMSHNCSNSLFLPAPSPQDQYDVKVTSHILLTRLAALEPDQVRARCWRGACRRVQAAGALSAVLWF